jgi:hypothetical protein
MNQSEGFAWSVASFAAAAPGDPRSATSDDSLKHHSAGFITGFDGAQEFFYKVRPGDTGTRSPRGPSSKIGRFGLRPATSAGAMHHIRTSAR